MPSCWLEAAVLLFGQTFGLAAEEMFVQRLDRPTRRCCVRLLNQSVNGWGTQTIGQVALRKGWRQLIWPISKRLDQDPAGDRLFAGHSHAQPHL